MAEALITRRGGPSFSNMVKSMTITTDFTNEGKGSNYITLPVNLGDTKLIIATELDIDYNNYEGEITDQRVGIYVNGEFVCGTEVLYHLNPYSDRVWIGHNQASTSRASGNVSLTVLY